MRVLVTSKARVQLQDLHPAHVRRILRALHRETRKTRRTYRGRRTDPWTGQIHVSGLAVLTVYRSEHFVLLLSIQRLPS